MVPSALESTASSLNLDLTGFGNVDIIRTGVGDDTLSGAAGNDTLDGGGGDDELLGGGDNDDLAGGEGFGSEDTVIDGGEDRDVAIHVDNGDLSLDLSATNLEVVIGGLGNDSFTVDDATQACVAGGEGSDMLKLGSGSGAPTVFWGGIGADTETMRELAWISYTPLRRGAFEDNWPDGNPFTAGVHSFGAIGAIDDPDRMGPWFVLGGSFEASGLLPGAGGYAVDMDALL